MPDHPALSIPYWIPQVRVVRLPRAIVNGVEVDATLTTTVYVPSATVQFLKMLAHFRALDFEEPVKRCIKCRRELHGYRSKLCRYCDPEASSE